jgi:L-seryl-tRNA(Ser) seleniumtransferase
LPVEEISRRAAAVADGLNQYAGWSAVLEDGESVIGGGSTPGQSLPTKLIAVTHATRSAAEIETLLRRNSPPIITRVERDRVLLDLRTVFEGQEQEIVRAFERVSPS